MKRDVPYAWESLPDFDLTKTTYTTIHPSGSQGWDTQQTRISQVRHERAMGSANGILSGLNPAHRVRFFVTDFETDIGIAGTYGQGRRLRDFYPHNMVMPVHRVTGIMLNQEDYVNLVEFIHEGHQQFMSNGEPMQFDLLAGGIARGHTLKGPHAPVKAFVYIESMPREHKQFVYAPVFSFSMAVVRQFEGIFKAVDLHETTQLGFLEVLAQQVKEGKEAPFSQAPKKK